MVGAAVGSTGHLGGGRWGAARCHGLVLQGLFSRENCRPGTLRARLRKFAFGRKSALVLTLGCRQQGSGPLVADIHCAGLRRNSSGASQGRLASMAPARGGMVKVTGVVLAAWFSAACGGFWV